MKRLLVPLFALGILLSACSPVDNDSGPIKIGFIGPLTGDASTYGADTLHGTQIAIEEINAAGGVNGRMIELIAEDGRCTGTDAASAAQKLINIDGVVAIAGPACSGETLGAAPIAESAQVPIISPTSTSPDITAAGDFIFRNIPDDGLAALATAVHLKEEGLLKVAMITENTDFCVAFGRSLKDAVGEENIVFEEMVEPGTKDYRTLIARLQNEDFDVFIANGQTVATAAAMITQLREQGLDQPLIGNNAIVSPTLIETAGEAVEGLKVVLPPSKGANKERFEAFTAKFLGQFGEAGSSIIYAALAYDVLGVYADAIAEVGTDGSAIRDYLYSMDSYDGAAGTFSFDDNGDVVGVPFELQQVTGGEFVTILDIPVN